MPGWKTLGEPVAVGDVGSDCRAGRVVLWDDLDRDPQTAVARLVESEADRFPRLAPKSSLHNDMGAEENAWNALITSLACDMMPEQPHR